MKSAKILSPPEPLNRYNLSKPLHADLLDPVQYQIEESYDWRHYLDKPVGSLKHIAVSNFRYAPLAPVFNHIRVGLKVEVPNRDYSEQYASLGGVYWMASVIRIIGYKALLRYEGFVDKPDYDFWMNLCCADIHPVGWCATEDRPLVPPRILQSIERDWKSFLVKRLTGSRTIPANWHLRVRDSILGGNFQPGDRLELLDRVISTRVRPAIVILVIGRRLHIQLSHNDLPQEPPSADDIQGQKGDWLDCGSSLIFPVGWAVRSNYGLCSNQEYRQHCQKIADSDPEGTGVGNEYGGRDAKPAQFELAPVIRRKMEDEK